MNSLNIARQGRSAIRQIRILAREGVLTPRELDRLLVKAEEGFDQMMGESEPAPAIPPSVRRGLTLVHDRGA